jgi:glycosyltransferase involved in cell wall biosynthesis
MVADDFPPCGAPGAAVRTEKLVEYLPEFGWETLVVCRDEGLGDGSTTGTVVRVKTPVPSTVSYQLGAWAWAWRLRETAKVLAVDYAPDLIYASCPPFPHALTAIGLGRTRGIPVVVDFRDAWSLDPHEGKGRLKAAAKRALCRWAYPRLEARVFAQAGAILLNTPTMEREYRLLFASAASRMHLVPNGYDEAAFAGCGGPPRRERPLLRYCGRFAGIAGRSPEILLRGMRLAIDNGLRFDLEILGDDSPMMRVAVRRLGLQEFVQIRPPVSNREAVRAMCEADALVVCQAPGRSGVTPVAGKTFEYLRAGRPILAVVPEGDNADLVRRYAAVAVVVNQECGEKVAAGMAKLLDRLGSGVGVVDAEFIEKYDRRSIAGKVAAVMDHVVGDKTRNAHTP